MVEPPMKKMNSIIVTHTSNVFDYSDIENNTISIIDIAASLSKMCRFSSHSTYFYPVASHCMLVSEMLKMEGESDLMQLYGLLHDASEAYVADLTSALKRTMSDEYKQIEKKVEARIFDSLVPSHSTSDIFEKNKDIIKRFDILSFFIEMQYCLAMPKNLENELIKHYTDSFGITMTDIQSARKKYSYLVEETVKDINFSQISLRAQLHKIEQHYVDKYTFLSAKI